MVIISTKAVDVSIQAVSPPLSLSAVTRNGSVGAAGAAASELAAGAGASAAALAGASSARAAHGSVQTSRLNITNPDACFLTKTLLESIFELNPCSEWREIP
jgi:hypothetical protein